MSQFFCVLGAGAMVSAVYVLKGDMTDTQFWAGWVIISIIFIAVDRLTR